MNPTEKTKTAAAQSSGAASAPAPQVPEDREVPGKTRPIPSSPADAGPVEGMHRQQENRFDALRQEEANVMSAGDAPTRNDILEEAAKHVEKMVEQHPHWTDDEHDGIILAAMAIRELKKS